MLIVKVKVKEIAQECGDFSVSSDFADELEKKGVELIKSACRRAKENGRRTVMSRDL
ncbi:MAG: DUF1931 domain-containing protein [archaeon]